MYFPCICSLYVKLGVYGQHTVKTRMHGKHAKYALSGHSLNHSQIYILTHAALVF